MICRIVRCSASEPKQSLFGCCSGTFSSASFYSSCFSPYYSCYSLSFRSSGSSCFCPWLLPFAPLSLMQRQSTRYLQQRQGVLRTQATSCSLFSLCVSILSDDFYDINDGIGRTVIYACCDSRLSKVKANRKQINPRKRLPAMVGFHLSIAFPCCHSRKRTNQNCEKRWFRKRKFFPSSVFLMSFPRNHRPMVVFAVVVVNVTLESELICVE